MSTPDWFRIIEQWRVKGMGQYGVTLPFLVGSLAYKSGESRLGEEHVRGVLEDIKNNPVDGYVSEVRWCGGVDAPVFTVSHLGSGIYSDCFLTRPNDDQASLIFSIDLQSTFGGLDCKDADECYEKLIDYAAKYVARGQYSRIRDKDNGGFKYDKFSPEDIKYIQGTIMP